MRFESSGSHGLFLFPGFWTIFQNLAGLAFEMGANGFERGETDGPGLAGFEDGKILRRDVHGGGQIVQSHFALRENHVQIDDDGHKLKRSVPVPPAIPALPSTAMRQK